MNTPQPSDEELLLVGRIVAPFGVRGQVKLAAVTDRPEHLARRVRTLYVGPKQMPMRATKIFEHKPGLLVLNFDGVADRDGAELLRGLEVFIRVRDAAPLANDEYYLHDLPGLRVENEQGEVIGEVREVLETGANEVLVVTRIGQPDALIPMIREIVRELNLGERRLIIRPLEGLL